MIQGTIREAQKELTEVWIVDFMHKWLVRNLPVSLALLQE